MMLPRHAVTFWSVRLIARNTRIPVSLPNIRPQLRSKVTRSRPLSDQRVIDPYPDLDYNGSSSDQL